MSRPAKTPTETWAAYVERLGAWEATAEGKAFLEEQRQLQIAEGAQLIADRRKSVLTAAGIPEKYWFMAAANPHETEAVKALREPITGLAVLSGVAGCGKTAAACWWVTQVPGGRFITAERLSRVSKWGDDIRQLIKAPRLVVDDLGVEYADEKGFFSSMLDGILNERYAAERPTVLTTNLTGEQFKLRYKERIVDRIREQNGFTSIQGGSLREAKQLGLLPTSAAPHL